MLTERDRTISNLVVTRAELERGAMETNPLVLKAKREGICL